MSRIPLSDTGANLRELKPYWLVAAIISFCILAQYVNYRILMNAAGRHLADWRLFAICVIDFAPWIILAPIIARTAGKYAPVSLRPVIFFHLPASVFCAVSVLCLTTLSRFYLEPSDISFGERLSRRLYYEFTWSFILYWFLVGVIFMTAYHRQYRKKAEDELRLTAEKARLERELLSTKLDALHQQFKPHFLFNALHAVSALMDTDTDKARTALVRISRLLRSALRFGEIERHALGDELEWLNEFMEIERLRNSTPMTLMFEGTQEVKNRQLPPMLLQPLVENAIRHGAGKNADGGCIIVSAAEVAGGLEIFIDDNGPGRADDFDCDGYGINLVRNRLRLAYGERSALSFTQSPSGGLRAAIFIPGS